MLIGNLSIGLAQVEKGGPMVTREQDKGSSRSIPSPQREIR